MDLKVLLLVCLCFLHIHCQSESSSEDDFSSATDTGDENISATDAGDEDISASQVDEALDFGRHEFIYKQHETKTGKGKGQKRLLVSLNIPPYFYKRRVVRGQRAEFSCNGCQKLGFTSLAKASVEPNSHSNGHDLYTLIDFSKEHMCAPSGIEVLVQEFKKRLLQRVTEDPTESIPAIYESTVCEFESKLHGEEVLSFLRDIPVSSTIIDQFCTGIEGISFLRHQRAK